MLSVIKKQGKTVQAYRLGDDNAVLSRLIAEKKLVLVEGGRYEVFSHEIAAAGSEHGQLASEGDYIKLDGDGYPYPNSAEFFSENHRHISGDEYEQLPKALKGWTVEEPMCPEVEFLIKEKGLVLDEGDPDRYFRAFLWGSLEAAAKDSVLVFYSISYGDDGAVKDADFNFVVRSEFDKTYDIL